MGVNYINDKDIRNLIRTKYLYTVVLPLPGQVTKDSENVALHTAGSPFNSEHPHFLLKSSDI